MVGLSWVLMIIKSVRLHNIRSYTDCTVGFPVGSVMLSGDIGSGKSTILLALEFALFGIMRGALEGAALLRNGNSAGFVEVRLDIDGKDVVARRSLKRSKDAVVQDSGYLIVDGRKVEGTAVELKSRILELLGYPAELVTKSKSLIYRYTVYTPQEEMKQILLDEKGYRLDTLRKVFQIDKYKRIRENAEVTIRSVKEQAKAYEGKAEGIEEKLMQKSAIESEIAELGSKLSSVEPELKKAVSLLKEKQEALSSAEEKVRELGELKKALEVASATVRQKEQLADSVASEVEYCDKKLTELMLNIKIKTGAEDLSNAKLKLSKDLKAEKAAAREELELVEKQVKEVNDIIARHRYEVERSEKLKRQVKEIDSCPLCLQSVTADHKHKISSDEDLKIASSLKLLEEQAEHKKELDSRSAELKKVYESILEKEKEAAVLQGELASAEERLSRKQGLAQRLSELKKEIEKIEAEKAMLAAKISQCSGLEEVFKNTRAELEEIRVKEKALSIKAAEIAKEIEGNKKGIVMIVEEIAKKEEARQRLAKLKSKQAWLGDCFIGLMDKMEKDVMRLVHSEFNELFQGWFSTLMEDAMSARLDDEFSPVIEQNGYEVSVANLSGGERTACALAYRLALNRVINRLITGIKTREIIILDEPTDGFSSQQLEKVRDVIDQLGVKQTIIVSHEPKIESFVDSIIRVSKNEHVSSVQ